MLKHHNEKIEIHECAFEAEIISATALIKFPCRLFVAWKSSTNSLISRTSKEDATLNQGIAEFNEKFTCQTYMMYDKDTGTYLRKQTTINLNLISLRKKDEEKLVGRIIVDLAAVMNEKAFQQLDSRPLEFCSARGGSLLFSIRNMGVKETELSPGELNLNEFSSILGTERNQTMSQNISTQNCPEKQQEGSPIKKQNQKLIPNQDPNADLIKVIEELKSNLSGVHEEKDVLEEEIRGLKGRIIDIQKNIVEELQNQLQEETQRRIQIQNECKEKLDKLKNDYDESQRQRLDFETQLLEIRYQLSELKAERQNMDETLKGRQAQIEKLNGQMQNLKKNILDASISNQKNESGDNGLKEDTAGLKQKIEEMDKMIEDLSIEKEKYFEELKVARRQKFEIEEEKKELEEKVLHSGDSINNDQLIDKINAFEQELQSLKQKLNSRESENVGLYEEIKKLQLDNQMLEEKCQRGGQQNQMLEKLIEEKTQLENSLSENRMLVQEREKIFQKKEKELQDALEQKQKLEEQNKIIEAERKRIHQEHQKCDTHMKVSKQARDDEEKEVTKMKNQLIEMNKVRAQLAAKNLRIQNENKGMQLKMNKIDRQLKNKQSSLRETKLQVQHLKKQLDTQYQKNKDHAAKIAKFAEKELQMRENILVLEMESKKIFDIILEKEENEDCYFQQLQEKTKDIIFLKEELAQIKASQEGALEENKKLKEEVYEFRKGNMEASPPVKDLQSQSNNQGEEGHETIVKYKNLLKHEQERVTELKSDAQKRDKELKQQIQRLNKQAEQKASTTAEKIKFLESDKAGLKNEKDALRDEVLKMRDISMEKDQKNKEKIESLNFTLAEKEERISDLKESIQMLRKRIQQLQKLNENYDLEVGNQKALIDKYMKKLENFAFERYELQRQKMAGGKDIEPGRFENAMKETLFGMVPPPLAPSANAEPPISKGDLLTACEQLKELMASRGKKESSEDMITMLINKNMLMEEGLEKITIERGVIQQNARSLSMHFQKIKSNALKSKGSHQEKKDFIASLRPCEQIVKQLIYLAETLSDVGLDLIEMND